MSGISSNSSALPSECGFIRMTVDDLSYTPSAEEVTRHADQRIATGRRSWRMLKGKNEAVWPPNLEAALLEALERYQPLRSGIYRSPGRFPMRNQFISNFIHQTTGKRRTPKQVGSRLQQLRDTSKKAKLVDLISRRDTPERRSEVTPPRPTRMPEEKASLSRHDDPANIMSSQRPFTAYRDKNHCVYDAEPTDHPFPSYSFSNVVHPHELPGYEGTAIRAACPPFNSDMCEPHQISRYNLHAQRYDYLCEGISNVGPWQMTPFIFPQFLSS